MNPKLKAFLYFLIIAAEVVFILFVRWAYTRNFIDQL
jgi:hypothetical protein